LLCLSLFAGNGRRQRKGHQGICYETDTIEQLAELCAVEPATIKHWWECFSEAVDTLINWLAGELAKSNRMIDWVGGNCDSKRKKGRKLFSLFGLYRSTSCIPEKCNDVAI